MTLRRPIRALVPPLAALLVIACLGRVGAAPPPGYNGGPGWWRIDPKSTFYRTSNDPKATTSFAFILAELPFASPSVPLTIEVYGDYRPNVATGDTKNVLHGVFSKTSTVLADSSLLRRVPGAILASRNTTSGPTYHGALPTEIPEDFRIIPDASGKYTIPVPAGAEWIIVCICDSYYGDNDDPDDDLWIRFTRQ
jgi:hypothetical protein